MSNFSKYQLEEILKNSERKRNVIIFGPVDNGVDTTVDALIVKSGVIITERNRMRMGDCRYFEEEKEENLIHGTIPYVHLYHKFANQTFLFVNIFKHNVHQKWANSDCQKEFPPRRFGRYDSEDFRNSDGGIAVVSAVEGVSPTFGLFEHLLEEMKEKLVTPILFITKIDFVILELQMEKEECYNKLERIIRNCNQVLNSENEEFIFNPIKSNVVFGSGLYEFGFSLDKFAGMYSSKFGVPKEKLVRRLWGENFFDPQGKKWRKTRFSEKMVLQRSFCQFVLDPIYKIFDVCMNNKKKKLERILKAIGIKLTYEEKNLVERKLLKVVMRKFLNLNDQLMESIQLHIPPPKIAQARRRKVIFEGNSSSFFSRSISRMNNTGPLMIFCGNNSFKTRRYRVGRIFSGSLSRKPRTIVRIIPFDEYGKRIEPMIQTHIQQFVIVSGRYFFVPKNGISVGNFCGLEFSRNHEFENFNSFMVLEDGVENINFLSSKDEEEIERMIDCFKLMEFYKMIIVGGLEIPILDIFFY